MRWAAAALLSVVLWASGPDRGTAQAVPVPVPDLPAADVSKPAEEGTLAHHIEREPACRERTNGCEVCVGGTSGGTSCSLPGIACQPSGWRCAIAPPKPETPRP